MSIKALVTDGPKLVKGTTFDDIQELKKVLNDSQVNEAVRRYHFILKTLNLENFQVDMSQTEFYLQVFKQSLLEQKISNIKGLS